MQFSDTTKLIFLALGAFFLSLGAAVLLFSVIEAVFFELHGIGLILSLSLVNVLVGAFLLLLRSRKSI
ncbi:MAG: hypothetical protein JST84_07570 [Acidobacteria bacterium]|nr:hypothetical protein [Acidobacteriota bacterium]